MNGKPECDTSHSKTKPKPIGRIYRKNVALSTLGCLGLLLGKKWALPLFVVSIVGVLSQTFHIWFLSDAIKVMGAMAVVMPLVAILIGAGMIWLAKSALSKHWLH
jgi:hypothetical protein